MAKKDHPVKKYRPPLKWAGSKYKVLDHLRKWLPSGSRLIEPFVGSGVVFLNTGYEKYLLNDANRDLIDFYRILKKEGPGFVEYARSFFTDDNNNSDQYYRLRTIFNTTDDKRLKAALFLLINKYGFNGLCRYNSKGESNVPFGDHKKPYFPENELIYFAEKLKKASLSCGDFSNVMRKSLAGDVVYCDPPYVPISKTANFTAYSAGGFGADEQARLAKEAEVAADRGVTVVISNHYTDFTKKIYSSATKYTFSVRRTISRDGAKRELACEVLAVFKGKN